VSDRCLLDRILEPGSLSVCFQPVVELRGTKAVPHYFEALIRGPKGTSAESPAILFEYARKKSRESSVDRACVAAILDAASRVLPDEATVGLNVHASTLAMDAGFVGFLESSLREHAVPGSRLVVEIVEHAPPWDAHGFSGALESLRAMGARIALDDVGLGHSNYHMILECRPDYFKVDRHFVDGCHRDFHRRAVLASVAHLARPFGARVVAEGVETGEDLQALRRLGLHLVQGYLLGRPTTVPTLEPIGLPALRPSRRGAAGSPARH
jgi:EAL domain-containing protein (putative c-di-GMP-specific phosphodiesterase class I)